MTARTCVLYVKGGTECQSPWFACRARARLALAILRRRYGSAVLYVD